MPETCHGGNRTGVCDKSPLHDSPFGATLALRVLSSFYQLFQESVSRFSYFYPYFGSQNHPKIPLFPVFALKTPQKIFACGALLFFRIFQNLKIFGSFIFINFSQNSIPDFLLMGGFIFNTPVVQKLADRSWTDRLSSLSPGLMSVSRKIEFTQNTFRVVIFSIFNSFVESCCIRKLSTSRYR